VNSFDDRQSKLDFLSSYRRQLALELFHLDEELGRLRKGMDEGSAPGNTLNRMADTTRTMAANSE